MSALIKSIAILHSDVRREYFSTQEEFETEKNAPADAKAIAYYAKNIAQTVHVIPADSHWVKKIIALRPSAVLNIVDSVNGDDTKTPLVCAALEMIGIPYTGNGFYPITACYDKYFVKQILKKNRIPTPEGFVIASPTGICAPSSFRFPAIVKLNSLHGSVGLDDSNIVHNEKELKTVATRLHKKFVCDVLVEEYIQGKEISAYLFDTSKGVRVIMSEDILNGGTDPYAIASYTFRWVEQNPVIETRVFKNKKIEMIMKKAYECFKMCGYSKFDARVRNGIPYIIDVNPNPAFAPPQNDSPFAKTAQSLFDIPFQTLLSTVINSALSKK